LKGKSITRHRPRLGILLDMTLSSGRAGRSDYLGGKKKVTKIWTTSSRGPLFGGGLFSSQKGGGGVLGKKRKKKKKRPTNDRRGVNKIEKGGRRRDGANKTDSRRSSGKMNREPKVTPPGNKARPRKRKKLPKKHRGRSTSGFVNNKETRSE